MLILFIIYSNTFEYYKKYKFKTVSSLIGYKIFKNLSKNLAVCFKLFIPPIIISNILI